jgi:hypothetical protein
VNLTSRWKQFFVHNASFAMLLLFATPFAAIAQTAIAPPPIESFFDNNAFGGAALSPSGRLLLVRTSSKGRRDFLVVIDLDTKVAKVVAAYSDADVGNFQWVNESRLAYDLRDATETSSDQRDGPGLYV